MKPSELDVKTGSEVNQAQSFFCVSIMAEIEIDISGSGAKFSGVAKKATKDQDGITGAVKETSQESKKASKADREAAKEAAKVRRSQIRTAGSLVRRHQDLRQEFKRELTALRTARADGAISNDEYLQTVDRIKQGHRDEAEAAVQASARAAEAARQGTKAYRDQQAQIKKGVSEVERLKTKNETLEESHYELAKAIRAAFDDGKLSANQYKTALNQLETEQKELANAQEKTSGSTGVDRLKKYARNIGLIAVAWKAATKVIEQYRQERDRATETTDSLVEARTSLRQISKNDFDALEQRADKLATDSRLGITREQSRELLFAGRSAGFEGGVGQVAAADSVIPIRAGIELAGAFRKFFEKERLSVTEGQNIGLAAAANSQFNISQILPQIQTAAQGNVSGNFQSSDVAAAVAVLADNFGRSTGDRIRALGVKLSTNTETQNLNLIQAVAKLSQNPELRKEITGDSQELQAVVAKFIERGRLIQQTDRRIESEQRQRGRNSLIGKAVAEATNLETSSGRIEVARKERIAAEQLKRVREEEKFSADANKSRAARQRVEAANVDDGLLNRTAGGAGTIAANTIGADQSRTEFFSDVSKHLFLNNPLARATGNAPELSFQRREEEARLALEKINQRLLAAQEKATREGASSVVSAINNQPRVIAN